MSLPPRYAHYNEEPEEPGSSETLESVISNTSMDSLVGRRNKRTDSRRKSAGGNQKPAGNKGPSYNEHPGSTTSKNSTGWTTKKICLYVVGGFGTIGLMGNLVSWSGLLKGSNAESGGKPTGGAADTVDQKVAQAAAGTANASVDDLPTPGPNFLQRSPNNDKQVRDPGDEGARMVRDRSVGSKSGRSAFHVRNEDIIMIILRTSR